jgi:deoxycytidylate deaminase/dephospho-CoA kinase
MGDKQIVIGLTGRFGSGCTTTLQWLATKNIKTFSLSDFVKKQALKKYPNINKQTQRWKRQILQDVGDEIRKDKEVDYLAKEVLDKIKETEHEEYIAVDGIRHPAEVNFFQDEFKQKFFLISIDAETEVRWARMSALYEDDRKQFDIDEQRDKEDKNNPEGQQVKQCMDLADIFLNSNEPFILGTLRNEPAIKRYCEKVDRYVEIMKTPGCRIAIPDELFMHQSHTIALSSSCVERKVGAVIVSERKTEIEDSLISQYYLIATGWNDVPIGAKHCKDKFEEIKVKCERNKIKKAFLENCLYCRRCGKKLSKKNFVCSKCKHDNKYLPGRFLDLCRAVHAEESAILQAARLGGIGLEGMKLYTTLYPCLLCAKMIVNSGIKEVIYLESYPMKESSEMFNETKVCTLKRYEGVNPKMYYRLYQTEARENYYETRLKKPKNKNKQQNY